MKPKFALSLLAALTLPACTTTESVLSPDYKDGRYADSSVGEPTPPAEGPRDVNANPAYIPTPLLRASAAGGL
jgi:hypothetical protein